MKVGIKYDFVSREIKHFLYDNFLNKYAVLDRGAIYSILKIQNFNISENGTVEFFGYLQNCESSGLGLLANPSSIVSILDDLESAKLFVENLE